MIQLKILSGKMAGTTFVARHFPVRIGRAAGADLQLAEPGVWDEHFQITLAGPEGFRFQTQPNALATINGEAAQQSTLGNGDLIEIGALKLQFSISEAPQRGLKLRETLVWAVIVAVTVTQLGIIYWLIQ
jgi:hypothetical protein